MFTSNRMRIYVYALQPPDTYIVSTNIAYMWNTCYTALKTFVPLRIPIGSYLYDVIATLSQSHIVYYVIMYIRYFYFGCPFTKDSQHLMRHFTHQLCPPFMPFHLQKAPKRLLRTMAYSKPKTRNII